MKHGDRVDVYPVGLLSDLRLLRGALKYGPSRRAAWWSFLYRFRRGTFERIYHGEWRALKNYFNGYLAEDPDPRVPRAGSGWTRRRALESLARIRSAHGLDPSAGA